MENLNVNDIVKMNNNYYKMIRKGQYLSTFINLKSKMTLSLNSQEIEGKIEAIYNTDEEKNIITNRIREERLKKMNINIKEFSKLSKNKRFDYLQKEEKLELSDLEKLDLKEYKKVDIDEEKLKTGMGNAAMDLVTVIKQITKSIENTNVMIDKFNVVYDTKELADTIDLSIRGQKIWCTSEIEEYLKEKKIKMDI